MSKKNEVNTLVRINVCLTEKIYNDLRPLFQKYGGVEETVIKALGTFKYIDEHMEEGWVVSVESEKENTRKEIIQL